MCGSMVDTNFRPLRLGEEKKKKEEEEERRIRRKIETTGVKYTIQYNTKVTQCTLVTKTVHWRITEFSVQPKTTETYRHKRTTKYQNRG